MKLEDLEKIPTSPGVYLWKDKNNNVIYIGKAINLKSRMKQYFKGSINSYKTHRLVQEIFSYQFYILKNSKEALILENKLIKEHKPKYNILLTDDKGFPYIEIALNSALEINLKWKVYKRANHLYYGPFPSGYGAKQLIKFLQSEFLYENGLPIKDTNSEHWKEKFLKIKSILSFKDKNYLKELEQKMYRASDELKFEIARDTKNFLTYLGKMQETQNVEMSEQKNLDVIAVIKVDDLLVVFMSFYRHGVLLSFQEKIVQTPFGINVALENFLNSYYANNFVPDKIILDYQFQAFNFELNFETLLEFPQKGEAKKVLDISYSNLKNDLEAKEAKFKQKQSLVTQNLLNLKKLLGLKDLTRIVLMDNSHIANSHPVSVIVTYVNGIKDPSSYRKFAIEQVNGRNADVEYMARGFEKFLLIKDSLKPDLLIVDGGLAQIHEVKKIMKIHEISLPVIGLVKNDKHTTKYLIDLDEQKIELENPLLLFLRQMQEEVDRYAKSFHRKKHLSSSLEGQLMQIPGIGLQKHKKLLAHFKNYLDIYNATIEQLTPLVGLSIAKKIKEITKN